MDGGTASGMVEIWRIDLQFAAVRREMVPLGAIFHSQPSQRLCQRPLFCAVSLLLCACRQCAECSAWLKSCRQQWLRRPRRVLRACVKRFGRVYMVFLRSVAGRILPIASSVRASMDALIVYVFVTWNKALNCIALLKSQKNRGTEFIPAFPAILSVPTLCVGGHILVPEGRKHVRRPRNHIVMA